jgi:hypothetical protein
VAPIDRSILSDLTRRLDRNLNNRLESNEARVRGWVGNQNGVVGTAEAADSVERGEAVIDRFSLAPYDAAQVAKRMSRNDGWISKDDLFISAAARSRMDGNGIGTRDGRISEDEMTLGLTRGDLAITRDGIFLSSEISAPSRPGSDRPLPPPTGGRPLPPPINDRPLPPPINDRPLPPPTGGRPLPPPINDRPVPPPVHPDFPPPPSWSTRSASQILGEFNSRNAELRRIYNSTPMTSDQMKRFERDLFTQAAEELIRGWDQPFAERNGALNAIFNATSMTSDEHKQFQRRLYTQAADDLLRQYHRPFSERKSALAALYNATSMSNDEHKGLERRLIDQEVIRIYHLPEPLSMRVDRINQLYNSTSMTSSERDAYQRRLLENAFGPRPW